MFIRKAFVGALAALTLLGSSGTLEAAKVHFGIYVGGGGYHRYHDPYYYNDRYCSGYHRRGYCAAPYDRHWDGYRYYHNGVYYYYSRPYYRKYYGGWYHSPRYRHHGWGFYFGPSYRYYRHRGHHPRHRRHHRHRH